MTTTIDGIKTSPRVRFQRTPRGLTARLVLPLILLVLASGGFVASKLIAVAVDHYRAASAAANLNFELGQLTEISNEFAQTTTPSIDRSSQATTIGRRVKSNLNVLEHSDFDRAEMTALATNVR